MTASESMSVSMNTALHRYEAVTDGTVAGFATVLESDTHIAFTHTEVLDEYQGQGVAGALASQALADAASRGKTIIPLCPYIARYLRRHEVPGAVIEWPNTSEPS